MDYDFYQRVKFRKVFDTAKDGGVQLFAKLLNLTFGNAVRTIQKSREDLRA